MKDLLNLGKKVDSKALTLKFVTARGPGGQNVNKVATAVLLRFDPAQADFLSEAVCVRLLKLAGKQVTRSGCIIIKADRYRTQIQNKLDALNRLSTLIKKAMVVPIPRKKTKPSLAEKAKRLNQKKHQAKIKQMRQVKKTEDSF